MGFSEQMRRVIFDKANGECEKCGKKLAFENHKEGEWGAWEAHHKTALSSNGSDNPSNGMALCLKCHKETRTYGKH